MEFCVLSKDNVLILEDISCNDTAEIITSLFKQGFILAPVLIEANNAEDARRSFINRFTWEELANALKNKKLLRG
ncbi:hypothetical protein [Zooshikella sp. RANM57]|uniref:hypothetical protein n=1 Tax=Zooshikella sp. RANM57 TaxID=3425863 RepID=UPI003D6DB756